MLSEIIRAVASLTINYVGVSESCGYQVFVEGLLWTTCILHLSLLCICPSPLNDASSQAVASLQCLLRQDCPESVTSPYLVRSSRPGQGGSCMVCLYVHRGSFKAMQLPNLVLQISENPPLKEKCFGCIPTGVGGLVRCWFKVCTRIKALLWQCQNNLQCFPFLCVASLDIFSSRM